MTIAEYQDLTGTTVSDADTNRVNAAIRKSEIKLGTLLGYSLSKQKKWTELGKAQFDGLVPFPSLPVSDETIDNLLPADDQTGDIQLFSLNELDKHFRINPAKEVYKAKIVLPVNDSEFITVHDFTSLTPYINQSGLVVALSRRHDWFTWGWWSSLRWPEKNNLMLAVDAEYVNCVDASKYPDLAYLLCDMINYYSDPAYSVMGNIRSESIDSHSYSRSSIVAKSTTGSTYDDYAPEGQPSAKLVIEKYAGPAAFRKRVA
jgi:hypothetical protein